MKQKTAMQEAINHLSVWVESGLSVEKWIENYADNLLEKEKEQIAEASLYGWRKCLNKDIKSIHPNDYYNETYKQD